MDMDAILVIVFAVINGAISGIISAGIGYGKSIKIQNFDIRKFLPTVILGAIIGGIAGYYGWSFEATWEHAAETGLLSGFIFLAQNISKLIIRRLGIDEKMKSKPKKKAKKKSKKKPKEEEE